MRKTTIPEIKKKVTKCAEKDPTRAGNKNNKSVNIFSASGGSLWRLGGDGRRLRRGRRRTRTRRRRRTRKKKKKKEDERV